MTSGSWLREEQADAAVAKILEAAAEAFATHGVGGAGMNEIARMAGCSRGTLYRYFKTRHDLHLAYVNHWALEIAGRIGKGLSAIEDPRERLTTAILRAVDEVRADRATASWFAPDDSSLAARMARGSEVVESMVQTFVARLLDPDGEDEADPLLARYLVRVMVSLLALPEPDPQDERALVERFIAPALVP